MKYVKNNKTKKGKLTQLYPSYSTVYKNGMG